MRMWFWLGVMGVVGIVGSEPKVEILRVPTPQSAAHTRGKTPSVLLSILDEAATELSLATYTRAMLKFAEPGASPAVWRPNGAICLQVVADQAWLTNGFWQNNGLPSLIREPVPGVPLVWLTTTRQILAASLAPYDVAVAGGMCPTGTGSATLVHTVIVLPWYTNGQPTAGAENIYGMAAVDVLGSSFYPSLLFLHPDMVANAVSAGRAMVHEVGHSLGLVHDADPYDPDGTWGYHDGVSPLLTAPLMGYPYVAPTAHWSRGLLFTTITGRASQDDVVLIKQRVARAAQRPLNQTVAAIVLLPTLPTEPLCVGLGAGLAEFQVPECVSAAVCSVHTLNLHVTPTFDPTDGLTVRLTEDFGAELYATEAAGVACVAYTPTAAASTTVALGTANSAVWSTLGASNDPGPWDVIQRFCRWQPVHLHPVYERCVVYGLVATALLVGWDGWVFGNRQKG